MDDHPDLRLRAVSEEQFGVFSRAHARAAGFSDGQIRNRVDDGRWHTEFRGVYSVAGAPLVWQGEILAACWAGGHRAVASHRSAAALWELPGGRRDLVEITCPRWRRGRHEGLVVHETTALEWLDLTHHEGIPITTPERTLLDLGAVCSPRVVDMALDAAIRKELVDARIIRAVLGRVGRRGRNGTGVLRRLIEERAPEHRAAESPAETRLMQVLRAHGLPEPELQYEIWDGRRFVARVDAAYPQWRIAIEYESYQEHTGKLALVRDNARRNEIVALGWHPVGATARDLNDTGHRLCAAILRISARSA
ncbi:MAG: type IV toxin-antitoxin system AbiEi family antitoxin domain-containing protein [Acidimicrobiia bacterium]